MTNDAGRKPEGAPERSPNAGAGACPFRKVRFAHIDGVAHQGLVAR
jgi:hypothetical protein